MKCYFWYILKPGQFRDNPNNRGKSCLKIDIFLGNLIQFDSSSLQSLSFQILTENSYSFQKKKSLLVLQLLVLPHVQFYSFQTFEFPILEIRTRTL
jgi:hypothetical protein